MTKRVNIFLAVLMIFAGATAIFATVVTHTQPIAMLIAAGLATVGLRSGWRKNKLEHKKIQ